MTPKERVLRCLEHKEPDRVPIDFSATPEIIKKLCEHLRCSNYDELLNRLHVDSRYVGPREVVFQKELYIGPALPRYPDGSWDDIWSIRRRPINCGGHVYEEVCFSPLANVTTVEEVERHAWPDPDWYDYSGIEPECRRYRDYALVGGSWGAVFGDSYRLQGMEIFLYNMVTKPEVVKAIVKKVEEFYFQVNLRIFEHAKGALDIYYMGNDFGTQLGLLISPQMFREFFAPSIKRLVTLAKSYGLKVMFHSCGAVRDIIPDLIELGVDVLDPVQVKAKGMDIESLKADFGSRIAFHGGIDTQEMMPFGNLEVIREGVRRTLDIMKPGGGYCIAPDQQLQHDVPLENILALYEAATELGAY